jgi:hypothetical protein
MPECDKNRVLAVCGFKSGTDADPGNGQHLRLITNQRRQFSFSDRYSAFDKQFLDRFCPVAAIDFERIACFSRPDNYITTYLILFEEKNIK